MNRQLIKIIILLLILVLLLFVGSPVEFLNCTADRIATILFGLTIIFIFIRLFRLAKHMDKKILKWVSVGLIFIVAIPYLIIGIWTSMLITSNPMWEDIAIYTNRTGDKLISQWRETSGSIYDYRTRKIIADFGQVRISYQIDDRKVKGMWVEKLLSKDSTFVVDLGIDKIDYSNGK